MIHPLKDRLVRLSAVLLLLILSACSAGTRLGYNHLGQLARWETGKYIDMTDAQKAAFDHEFKPAWDWHRRTQLPLYAAELRKMAALLDAGNPDRATLDRLSDEFEAFGTAIAEQTRPGAARLLALLDDTQIDKFVADRHKEFDKTFSKQRGRSLDARKGKEQIEREDAVKTWFGPLNAVQKAVLAEEIDEDIARGTFDPDAVRAERNRQLDRFVALLKQRHAPGFESRIKAMQTPTDPADRREEDDIEARNRDRLTALAATMDARQRHYLQQRLQSFAEDCDALAAEALPPQPEHAAGS